MAKNELRSIVLGESEHNMLLALLERHNSEEFMNLYEEVDSATVVDDNDVPGNVVRMHSLVTFSDVASQEESTVRLVYPGEVNRMPLSVSVLAPVGAALIGLREGESITWPLPNGRQKTITVLKVTEG